MVSKCHLCFICCCPTPLSPLLSHTRAGGVEQQGGGDVFFFCVFFFFTTRAFKATVSQHFPQSQINFALKATDAKCEATSTEMRSVSRGSFYSGIAECDPSHASDLSVWISSTNSVLCTWSDPRKRSATLVSMNRLTPPSPTPGV